MGNEQEYLAKINELCRLPYAKREQKHQWLFKLADELEALPPCDGRNRLLGRIYAELSHYETAAAYFSAIADKSRKDIKNLFAQQEAAKRFGSSHAVARNAAKRKARAIVEAVQEKLAAAITAAAERWYRDKH
ncbi:hypothetical protein H9Q10_09695 [Eikenella sp. S3360]|uniref:Uncharacterized protein n=1 Tax=Eikenella glucosivorans TaxID=2766967 RepID=A0ABS0NCE9_9NEIS|nr:hypothetical protein [Eikenella glucosivorans]MBH5329937.1 hypothetical protein [Eikenella glucosivorans]